MFCFGVHSGIVLIYLRMVLSWKKPAGWHPTWDKLGDNPEIQIVFVDHHTVIFDEAGMLTSAKASNL